MESVPDLITHVGRNELKQGSADYVLTDNDKSWIVYASDGSEPLGLKDLPAGNYDARWYDCLGGHDVVPDPECRPSGDHTWQKPNALGNQVVLHLRRSLCAAAPKGSAPDEKISPDCDCPASRS